MASSREKLEVILKKIQDHIQTVLVSLTEEDQGKILASFVSMIKEIDSVITPVSPTMSFCLDMDGGGSPPVPAFGQFGELFELIEPGPSRQKGNTRFTLTEYMSEGEKIDGVSLKIRARTTGGYLGLEDGETILHLQDKVSSEIRKQFSIPLPASLFRHKKDKTLWMACLRRNNGKSVDGTGRWTPILCPVDEAVYYKYGRLLVPSCVEDSANS